MLAMFQMVCLVLYVHYLILSPNRSMYCHCNLYSRRHRGIRTVTFPVQGHTQLYWQNWDFCPSRSDSKVIVLMHHSILDCLIFIFKNILLFNYYSEPVVIKVNLTCIPNTPDNNSKVGKMKPDHFT